MSGVKMVKGILIEPEPLSHSLSTFKSVMRMLVYIGKRNNFKCITAMAAVTFYSDHTTHHRYNVTCQRCTDRQNQSRSALRKTRVFFCYT